MTINIAINGYGRIGRCILRAIYENNLQNIFKIIAINDLGSIENNIHLTKYDTTHGIFKKNVIIKKNNMLIDKDSINMLAEKNPSKLPWKKLNIDIVFECTGLFTSKIKSMQHIQAGAKKVLISAPADKDVDATIVYGVNHQILNSNMQIVSNASCTTNCLSPIVKLLNDQIGIKEGLMTTIHSYTNDQSIVDSYHNDIYRARAAAHNMIPTKTGAAQAVGLVLPELEGLLNGFAIRVPTINVSVVDLTVITKRTTNINYINNIFYEASKNNFKNILGYNKDSLVSMDFNHNNLPSIFDSTQTRVIGNLVKVLAWYDNEWGFSNQMLRTTLAWFEINHESI